MNKIKYIIIFLLFAISCTQKNANLEYLICRDSVQYWRWKNYYEDSIFWDISRFDNHGNFKWYWIDKHRNIRSLIDHNDKDIRFKWYVTNDSILVINNRVKYKIIKCTKDTIILKTIKRENYIDTFYLYRQNENIKVINRGDRGDTLRMQKTMNVKNL
jgi:hypothetical protein